jgi:hypothetical protein
MAEKEKEEVFNEKTRRLDGHRLTDIRVMRSDIMKMCQEMRLGGELSIMPISKEGFLECSEEEP